MLGAKHLRDGKEVYPLLTQMVALCEAHGIPMLAAFQLTSAQACPTNDLLQSPVFMEGFLMLFVFLSFGLWAEESLRRHLAYVRANMRAMSPYGEDDEDA
jgi:hypothetical protein